MVALNSSDTPFEDETKILNNLKERRKKMKCVNICTVGSKKKVQGNVADIKSVYNLNKPGNADNNGGDSHVSIGRPLPLQPIRCGSWEKCDSPKRRLSDFS